MRPRKQEQRCPHYWILSGAVLLGSLDALEQAKIPVQARPGPEVPFVSSEALSNPNIKAVISQVAVGSHTAYPIIYFSAQKPVEIIYPFSEWSCQNAIWIQEDGRDQYEIANFRKKIDDFNLVPWLQMGQLFWIAPNDSSMTLQTSVENCPYLGLSGTHEFLKIYEGEVSVL